MPSAYNMEMLFKSFVHVLCSNQDDTMVVTNVYHCKRFLSHLLKTFTEKNFSCYNFILEFGFRKKVWQIVRLV